MGRTLSELDWLRMLDLWVNTPTFAWLGAQDGAPGFVGG
jgi:hypothetical protein